MSNLNNYQEAIKFCFSAHNKFDIQGWETLHEFDNISSNKNLDAKVYKQGNRIVLSFSGSNLLSLNDIRNDASIMYKNKSIPSQFGDAERLYKIVKARYPNSKIESTGYSLGATLSNLLSHRTGIKSTAIAPIGSKHIADKYKNYFKYDDSNITTYGRKGDNLFYNNLNKQSGNIYIIPDLPQDYSNEFGAQHLLHNYTPYNLYQAKPLNQNLQYRGKMPTGQASPIDNIYTREKIDKMTTEEFRDHEKAIFNQLNTIGIPLEKQLNQKNNIEGYVNQVSGKSNIFTREDIKNMTNDEFRQQEADSQLALPDCEKPNEVKHLFQKVRNEVSKVLSAA